MAVLVLALAALGNLPSAAGETHSTPPSLASRLDELVPLLMAEHKVPGVSIAVIEHGRLAWERQYGVRRAGSDEPVTANTLFEAASMSKPIGAYVALKLAEQGKLDLDRPLHEYLGRSYLTDHPLHPKITARMVLSHSTGLPNWRKGGVLAMEAEPGARFTYSGEGFTFLQQAIEHVTGEAFEPYVNRTLLEPLGMISGGFSWRDGFGAIAASGHDSQGKILQGRKLYVRANIAYSFYSSARDYALFLVEIMKPDRSAPHSIHAESLEAMLTPVTPIPAGWPFLQRSSARLLSSYYGLGWVIDLTSDGKRVRHSGTNATGFRAYCEFYPQRGSGMVIMTNAAGGAALWRELIKMLGEP